MAVVAKKVPKSTGIPAWFPVRLPAETMERQKHFQTAINVTLGSCLRTGSKLCIGSFSSSLQCLQWELRWPGQSLCLALSWVAKGGCDDSHPRVQSIQWCRTGCPINQPCWQGTDWSIWDLGFQALCRYGKRQAVPLHMDTVWTEQCHCPEGSLLLMLSQIELWAPPSNSRLFKGPGYPPTGAQSLYCSFHKLASHAANLCTPVTWEVINLMCI